MRSELINPFLRAAVEVLTAELGETPVRGQVTLATSSHASHEVTALIGVTGDLVGMVLVGLATETARNVASRMMGQEFPEFDDLAQSGIGEVANVVAGRAAVLLGETGLTCDISPPALAVGATLSMLALPRIVIPLDTAQGAVNVEVSLKAVGPVQ
ncbi:MAG: chemotaxis protein CheX [Chloroflexota bacterium]